jgi:hypothetical protein
MSTNALPYDKFSRAGAVVASFFAALPLMTLSGALFMGPLLALAGIAATPWRRLAKAAVAAGLPLAIAMAFLVWVGASSRWASPPGLAGDIVLFAPCALLFVMAAGVGRPVDRQLIRRAGLAGLAIVLAILSAEAWLDFPVGRELAEPVPHVSVVVEAPGAKPENAAAERAAAVEPLQDQKKTRTGDAAFFAADAARTATIALLCFWGVAAGLAPHGWRGMVAIAALAGAVFGLNLQFGGMMNVAVFAVGSGAAMLALVWPRATISISAQIAAGAIAFAPVILPQIADLSAQGLKQFFGVDAPFGWQARAQMWAFAADRIKEKLLIGWGFGGSGHFTETYNLLGFTLPYIPRHPQNAPLQIWLDTGAIGAVLAAGALASFGRRAGAAFAENRPGAAAAAGLLVSASLFANMNMNVWAIWWWAAIAAGAGLVRVAGRSP